MAPQPLPLPAPTFTSKCTSCWETLCRICAILTNKRKTGDRCVYFPEDVSNRPDPCIYDQFMLMQLKLPVTWDNPDVAIFKGGVEQFTYDLTVDTEYDVAITVHNNSKEKEALGTHVEVRWIEFGAGAPVRHFITSLIADVPVWPGTAVVHTPWRTPASPGHYCIEVELSHPKDANPANNLGWNNTQVKKAASQVRSPIRIFNRWVAGPPIDQRAAARLDAFASAQGPGRAPPWNYVEIEVDSYVFADAYGDDAHPDVMFAPRAPAWPVSVEPRLFAFDLGEAYRDVDLIVDAPDGPGHPEQFNVTAWQGGAPLGGVTVTVQRGG